MEGIVPGIGIYRNHDHFYAKQLERSKTRRTLAVEAVVRIREDRITLLISDAEGTRVAQSVDGRFEPARHPEQAAQAVRQQIAKTGETIFRIRTIDLKWDVPRFVPASALNRLRRETLEALELRREKNYWREKRAPADATARFPQTSLDYRANVTNRKAEAFYRRHGVKDIEPGVELRTDYIGLEVMRSRYCLRREMGTCLQEKNCAYRGPMYLENNNHILELQFDCARCEMAVIYKGKRP
ncbi:MAG: DUF3656 domain-containing protein [Rikenellaceae bacterium]|nr:DUF3656 domain-containing protein [Rikenellaceae bacterium]